jgi:hypothetical protein
MFRLKVVRIQQYKSKLLVFAIISCLFVEKVKFITHACFYENTSYTENLFESLFTSYSGFQRAEYDFQNDV